MKKVSIIIPTFNAERYISDVIDSILCQTLQEWELIIVDDGSVDSTISIIQGYSDDRIHFLERDREPKGSVTCRNIGQCLVDTEYFIHFDADDIIMPFCLEQRVSFMDNHPELDFATFKGASIIDTDDGSYKICSRKWGRPNNKDDLSAFLSTNYPYSVWNNIYRSASFSDYFWDENVSIYTDFSYIVPCLANNKNHGYDKNSKEDYLYRIGQKNAMTQSFISDKKYDSTKYLFSKTLELINSTTNIEQYRNDFYNFYRLQFKRILSDGTIKQVEDFYRFILSSYPDKNNFQCKMVYYFTYPFLKIGGNYSKSIIKKMSIFVLRPSSIYNMIRTKIESSVFKNKS